jgi:hypothetical protein
MDILDKEVEKIYSVFNSVETSRNIFKSNEDYLHQKRLALDPFIFDSLKLLYSSQLKEHWNSVEIPYNSDKAIIIVERRCHLNLEFILHNLAYFARGYAIHIFCSKANLSFIEAICSPQINNIHIHTIFENIGTPEEGKKEYNNLLRTSNFWNLLKEEHILTVETDCYLLEHIPDSIYEYDYVASLWPWHPLEPGGGGLSYRKRSIILKIFEIENTLLDSSTMQDSFSSTGIKLLGGKYSHNFFTECAHFKNPVGTHQWWTFYQINFPKHIIKDYLTLKL